MTETSEPARGIAYFSMEIGLENAMPTYSGGLGALAGDTVRAAADLEIPLLAVTLLHRKGYFFQKISGGRQSEEPVEWVVEDFLEPLPQRVSVPVEGREVFLRAWRCSVRGIKGHVVPVYFLDSDLEENSPEHRRITHFLYGGDQGYRLSQEIVLGMGGVRMLRALGHGHIRRFHMNEGHASLLTLELLDEQAALGGRRDILPEDIAAVRRLCVFTTHTPVSAGFDRYPEELARRLLGRGDIFEKQDLFSHEGLLNMTFLGFNLSHYINGVAKKHGEVSQQMFSRYQVDSITNGVHAARWACEPLRDLFDRHIPDWRQDNFSLRYALGIPRPELWSAHALAKKALLERVNRVTNAGLKEEAFTLGFARRSAEYKRADLLFQDVGRLKALAERSGPLQAIFAGKAHPQDEPGKEMIRRVLSAIESLRGHVKAVYIQNYDMDWARMMTAGTDLWLNTPQPLLEASGTSGMKAAVNGVPSLSVKDGWWIEGHIEGVTGWAIGTGDPRAHDPSRDADFIYQKLEEVILPLFYKDRDLYIDVMRHAIALNGSYFNTQRMMQQYVVKAYMPG